jgi:Ni2+-binding GTPase involved in maturation of urease and hydrogenase
MILNYLEHYMKIHLVSGFLGSGKTTAIISASKALMAQGFKVGVITNDQGKYLVDTHFMRLNDIPAVEVNGGCFCCNYGDFNQSLEQITHEIKPDVVFAESVGSCADIVATVVKPLMEFKTSHEEDTTLTTFTDARLLKIYLEGGDLPFQDNVIYIFEQQIQEAGILVVNKVDLLADDVLGDLLDRTAQRFPDKQILPLVSLTSESVTPWLERLQNSLQYATAPLKISYKIYGSGEQELAWYDAQLRVQTGTKPAIAWVKDFLGLVAHQIIKQNIPVGHLKFLLSDGVHHQKISLVSGDTAPEFVIDRPEDWGTTVELTVNARLEGSKEQIQQIFQRCLAESIDSLKTKVTVLAEESFHPGFPNPTYRFPMI